MSQRSMLGQGRALASPKAQIEALRAVPGITDFAERLSGTPERTLRARAPDVLQINVGKLCNQACGHCHVDAGPDRREIMTRATMDACLDLASRLGVSAVDITGGAPEMNPEFKWLVSELRTRGFRVQDRCNLTILLTPGFTDLPQFLAAHEVEIIASLPYFLPDETNAQRGHGVFEKSVHAITKLNELGYGRDGSTLRLNLVTNPQGAWLPGSEAELESDFRRELFSRHGIVFNRLFALANLPISRFLEFLVQSGNLSRYLQRLEAAFNPATLELLMCRTTLSVGYDGRLYDCDFNQMLDLEALDGRLGTVFTPNLKALSDRLIRTDRHCYGCTAGAGSSCGGSLVLPSRESSTSLI